MTSILEEIVLLHGWALIHLQLTVAIIQPHIFQISIQTVWALHPIVGVLLPPTALVVLMFLSLLQRKTCKHTVRQIWSCTIHLAQVRYLFHPAFLHFRKIKNKRFFMLEEDTALAFHQRFMQAR